MSFILIFGLLLFKLLLCQAMAVDKSGLKPTLLSLPSGPSSIEGLGESFQPNLATGSAQYRVKLTVLPGVGDLEPELALVYESGAGNSCVGIGWSLADFPYIQRQTDKGLPSYIDQDVLITHFGEELVPVQASPRSGPRLSWRCENEADFFRYERVGEGWICDQPEGRRIYFGQTVTSRIERPANNGGGTYKWLCDRIADTNGNVINYDYIKDGGQIYPRTIHYNQFGGHENRIEFLYDGLDYSTVDSLRADLRPQGLRTDILADYRSTFKIETRLRLRHIRMMSVEGLIRTYEMHYKADSTFSRLAEVREYGSGFDPTIVNAPTPVMNVDYLPPVSFQYAYEAAGPYVPAMVSVLQPPAPLANAPERDFIDLNADGLPDLIDTRGLDQYPSNRYYAYMNRGADTQGRVSFSLPVQPANAPNDLTLDQSTVLLADVDGDGQSDVVTKNGFLNNQFGYAKTRPNGTFEPSLRLFGSNPGSFLFNDPDVRMLDLDFDKRVDLVKGATYVGGQWRLLLYINQGPGQPWREEETVVPPGVNLSDPTIQWADMNGDRLLDLVMLPTARYLPVIYYPHKGLARLDNQVSLGNIPDLISGFEYLKLIDINSDGLSDLVLVQYGIVDYWLNLGNGQFSSRQRVSGTPPLRPQTAVRFLDLNGNGSTDIMWNDPQLQPTYQFMDLVGNVPGGLLTGIDNNLGRRIHIAYDSSTNLRQQAEREGHPWSQALPIAVQVVSEFTVEDGMGGTYSTKLFYADGYYDGNEKEFRGFGRVYRQELGDSTVPTLLTETLFDTGATTEALKGRILRQADYERRDDRPVYAPPDLSHDVVFQVQETSWTTRELFRVEGIPDFHGEEEHNFKSVNYAHEIENRQYLIENRPERQLMLRVKTAFDDFGNLTRRDDEGVVGREGDERRLTYVYALNLDRWLLRDVARQEVRRMDDTVVARSEFYYDGEDYVGLPLGQVELRNLKRQLDWHTPDDPNGYVISKRQRHDRYGNLTGLCDALAQFKSGRPDPVVGHFREFEYDSVFHIFPVRETIFTGNTETGETTPRLSVLATYHLGRGAVTSSTDFNDHMTDYRYDPFGRLTNIIKPLDTADFPTVTYEYALAQTIGGGRKINWVETRQREHSGTEQTLDSRVFYDGLGRKIMTRAEGEEPDQVVVSDTTQFNARKAAWKKYLPYFETGSRGTLDYQEPPFTSGFTEHQYDAIGREVTIFQPPAPGAVTRKYSRVTYEPLTRRVEDEEQTDNTDQDGDPPSMHYGCAMRYGEDGLLNKDGKGRLRTVEEIVKLNDDGTFRDTPTTWTTTYDYNLLDNLTGYTDSQNNRKRLVYDGLGRRYFMDDPDRSWMWYAFDDGGNITRTRDAKGQEIAYAYDGVNRLSAEYYCNAGERTGNQLQPSERWARPGDAPTTPSVSYHYDRPGGPVSIDIPASGEVQAVHQALLHEMKPDPAGFDLNQDGIGDVADLVTAIRRRNDSTTFGQTFTARNARGVLSWVRDLSGEEHTSYDERGRAEWVIKRIVGETPGTLKSFITAQTYDSMDRVTRLTYPDLTSVDYLYNSRGLLEEIPGAITRLDYNPTGQNACLDLACGTVTTRDYDYRLRLGRLRTIRTRDNLTIQDLVYAYDGVSNINAITDGRSTVDLEQIGAELDLPPTEARKFDLTQSLHYDSLYRLTQSANPDIFGVIDYQYDRIGNMVRKAAALITPAPLMDLGLMYHGGVAGAWHRDGRAPGSPPGPHAVTKAVQGSQEILNFDYDDNGNMLSKSGLSMAWDHKDHLTELTTGTETEKITYDYTDRRICKKPREKSPVNLKLYIDRYSKLEGDCLYKYVFVGNCRILQNHANLVNGITTNHNIFYILDHLDTPCLTVFGDGKIGNMEAIYSDGQPRIEAYNGSWFNTYKFHDKIYEPDSGLYYFESRYYLPSLCTFLSCDSRYAFLNRSDSSTKELTENPLNMNLYAFALRSPLNNVDPTGQRTIKMTSRLISKVAIGLMDKNIGAAWGIKNRSGTISLNRPLEKQTVDCSGVLDYVMKKRGLNPGGWISGRFGDEGFSALEQKGFGTSFIASGFQEFKPGDLITYVKRDAKGKRIAGHMGVVVQGEDGNLKVIDSSVVNLSTFDKIVYAMNRFTGNLLSEIGMQEDSIGMTDLQKWMKSRQGKANTFYGFRFKEKIQVPD